MLLPSKFQTLMTQDGGLGPVKREPVPAPVAHVHAWRMSPASRHHKVCTTCGVVELEVLTRAPVKPAVVEDGDALDWYGLDWTPHVGTKCPVAQNAQINVRLADGCEYTWEYAGQWLWDAADVCTSGGEITHWRYAAVTAKPQPDADGWIEHTGDEAPVPVGTCIDLKSPACSATRYGIKTQPQLKWHKVTHWRIAK